MYAAVDTDACGFASATGERNSASEVISELNSGEGRGQRGAFPVDAHYG